MKYEDHIDSFIRLRPALSQDDFEIIKVVNRRIDQFAHFPNWDTLQGHRKFLHHVEGIAYFGLAYGNIGAEAAHQHVLDDLGHIPTMADYVSGVVDGLGNRA